MSSLVRRESNSTHPTTTLLNLIKGGSNSTLSNVAKSTMSYEGLVRPKRLDPT